MELLLVWKDMLINSSDIDLIVRFWVDGEVSLKVRSKHFCFVRGSVDGSLGSMDGSGWF